MPVLLFALAHVHYVFRLTGVHLSVWHLRGGTVFQHADRVHAVRQTLWRP